MFASSVTQGRSNGFEQYSFVFIFNDLPKSTLYIYFLLDDRAMINYAQSALLPHTLVWVQTLVIHYLLISVLMEANSVQ